MKFPRTSLLPLLALAALMLTASSARAAVLNWSTVTWSGTSQSYNVDGVAGNDITVSYTNSAGVSSPASAITSVNGATDLRLSTSGMGASLTNNFTVTITFIGTYAVGVKNVTFTLNDVDANLSSGGFQDRISFTALDGATPISITASNSGGTSVNTITGSPGTNPVATGNSSTGTNPEGDVSINTGTTKLNSISFVWTNPNASFRGTQWIGLGNINFTVIPEVASGSAALILCGAFLAFGRRRVRQVAA